VAHPTPKKEEFALEDMKASASPRTPLPAGSQLRRLGARRGGASSSDLGETHWPILPNSLDSSNDQSGERKPLRSGRSGRAGVSDCLCSLVFVSSKLLNRTTGGQSRK
jgi:hypothetical protein